MEVIKLNEDGLMCLEYFESLFELYKDCLVKIVVIIFCFNVMGFKMLYYEVVEVIYVVGGLCFVDFVCLVFYIDIVMWFEWEE